MCGIVGMVSVENDKECFSFFKELLKESQIRGKHATGISFYKGNKLITIKSKEPAEKFIKGLNFVSYSNFYLGHTRYSTSDLRFNQPINENNISLAHNGVLTQSDPKDWFKEFNYTTKTENDSELLLKFIEKENIKDVFKKFTKSSISAGIIKDKTLFQFRNTKRPLWLIKFKSHNKIRCLIFCSTLDIFDRAFDKIKFPMEYFLNKISPEVEKTKAGVLYTSKLKGKEIILSSEKLFSFKEDLQ